MFLALKHENNHQSVCCWYQHLFPTSVWSDSHLCEESCSLSCLRMTEASGLQETVVSYTSEGRSRPVSEGNASAPIYLRWSQRAEKSERHWKKSLGPQNRVGIFLSKFHFSHPGLLNVHPGVGGHLDGLFWSTRLQRKIWQNNHD